MSGQDALSVADRFVHPFGLEDGLLARMQEPCLSRGFQPVPLSLHEDGRGHTDVETFGESMHGDFNKGIGVFHHEVRCA